MSSRRALHFVLKIGDRPAMIDFLKNTLEMKVLRHEEFEEGNLLKVIDNKTVRRQRCLFFQKVLEHLSFPQTQEPFIFLNLNF